MTTNDSYSTSGLLQTPSPSGKQSSPASKPSEQSPQKSTMQRSPIRSDRPRNESEALERVQALFAGATPNEVEDEADGDQEREAVQDDELRDEAETGEDEGGRGSGDSDLGGGDDEGAAEKIALPDTFDPKELAAQLGITTKDFYERMQITLKETGETISLGDWKDRVQDQAKAAREHDQKLEVLSRREAKVNEDLMLLDTIANELNGKVDPRVFNAAVERHQQRTRQEQIRLLQKMPELKDRATFESFRGEVVEHLAAYGFQPHELVIADHRVLLAVKDLIDKSKRLKRLQDFDPERERKANGSKPQKPIKRTSQFQKRRSNIRGEEDRVNAVASLLSGG